MTEKKPSASLRQRLRALWLAMKWCWQAAPVLITISMVLSLATGLLALAGPYLFKLLLDTLVGPDGKPTQVAAGTMLGLLAVIGTLRMLQGLSGDAVNAIKRVAAHRIDRKVRHDIMAKITSLDVSYSEQPQYHETLQRTANGMWRIPESFYQATWFLGEAAAIVAIVSVLFAFDWRIVAIVIAGAIPGIIFAFKLSEVLWSAFDSGSPIARRASYYQNIMTQRPRAMREIRLFGLREPFLRRFTNLITEFIKEEDKASRKQLGLLFFAVLAEAIAALIAAWLVIGTFSAGLITVGTLTMLWALLMDFAGHMRWGVRLVGELNTHALFMQPLLQVLDYEPRVKEPAQPTPLGHLEKVELRGVTHTYDGKPEPALRNVSLTLNAGECIAIVGENGCGKSTLTKMLCRLYDPKDGAVLMNGIDIREAGQRELHSRVGVLFQDYFQYEAPVGENIRYGDWAVESQPQVEEAARKAGADFITCLAKGFETHLGRTIDPDGVELSGGQWQKVALARAFYTDADLLILDEPTAAIDARAEEALFRQFKGLTQGRMSVIISHRFSTVRMADRIIVMDKGSILEQGTHEELMALDGRYAGLFHLQAKGYLDEPPKEAALEA
jgi:ATP-binding cassette subfamily B protein